MSDLWVQFAAALAVTAVSAYLLIRLATYIRGHRPLVHPRLLSFFELGREPPRVGRAVLSVDVWVGVAILVVVEFVAATILFDAVASRDTTSAGLWCFHFVAVVVWAGYVWRSVGSWRVVGAFLATTPVSIDGVDVWRQEWRGTGESVELPHPDYPKQSHRMNVYEIESDGRRIRFAAGELSNGVWGFYVPVTTSA